MPKPKCPLEEAEQIAFVNWLTAKSIKHTSIPNSTYTTSWAQKTKNKRTGLRAGLPDLLLVIPNKCLIFVEMKRQKSSPSKTSAAQLEWIKILNTVPNVECRVCNGAEAAIKFINEII